MRIGADTRECKLDHVSLGDDHRAAGAQPPHDRGVGRGRFRLLGENLGAGPRRLTGHIEQVLDADNGAIERPERNAKARPRIGRIGRRACRVLIDGEAGACALPLRVGNARQRLFEPVPAGCVLHDWICHQ